MKNKTLGGRYRIQERIGEGGMAFVYLALDVKLGRRVAIKVLHEHMEKNEDIRKRFQMEAQAISSLDHPNIVKIYDFSGDESERLWIVTEVIRGQNLAQLVQEKPGQSLHPVPAACIVREICKALYKAHTTGIVHRDIKPENVMITNEGRVKLMDFGIAKDMQKSNLTLTGTFMGSPSYMSPEQIRGRDVDSRSDIYSLGVLFYEIVTGKLPYTGQTTHDVVMRIMEGEFTYPRFLLPTLAPEVDTAIVRAMQKDAGKRFQSIAEFGDAIDHFLTTYGHVESHVELERYFKDRRGYEEKLKRSPALGTIAGPIPSPGHTPKNHMMTSSRQNVHIATTRDRASQAPHGRQTAQQTIPVPQVAATAHVPYQRNSQIIRSEVPAPMVVVSKTAEAPQERMARPERAPNAAIPGRTLPPRAFPHVRASVKSPAQPRQEVQKRHVRPRVPRRSSIRYHAVPREQYAALPAAHQYLIGFLLVGVIVALTLWGFWELQNRISDQPVKSPKNVEKAFRNDSQRHPGKKQPIDAISNPAKGSQKKIETEEGSASVAAQKQSANPDSTKDTRHSPRIGRSPADGNVKSSTPSTATPTSTRRSASSRKSEKNTRNAGAVKPEQRPEQRPEQKPDKRPESKPEKRIAVAPTTPEKPLSDKGEFSVSSQPAAEIWVDGKKLGTTVDQTSGSGWITLATGNHTLELRRSGYETWEEKIVIEGGERKKIQSIALQKNQQTGGSVESYSLTISAQPIPATVSLKNLDTGNTESFTLNEPGRTMDLPPGHYHIKVEKNGVVKERKLNLTGNTRSLTFSVEFKEEKAIENGKTEED